MHGPRTQWQRPHSVPRRGVRRRRCARAEGRTEPRRATAHPGEPYMRWAGGAPPVSVLAVHPLTPDQIRLSLINCSRGQAKTLTLPPVDQIDWGNLDYLGWRDPRAPLRAVLVAERPEGPVGVALRIPNAGARPRASAMCNLCQCTQPTDGVLLFSAAKAGESGRSGEQRRNLHLCRLGLFPVPARAAAAGDEVRPRHPPARAGRRSPVAVGRISRFRCQVLNGPTDAAGHRPPQGRGDCELS